MGCGCHERRQRYRKARAAGKSAVDASLEMMGIKTRKRGDKKAAARAARAAEEEARARRVAQEDELEYQDEQAGFGERGSRQDGTDGDGTSGGVPAGQ